MARLAIARRLAHQLGGEISYYGSTASEAPPLPSFLTSLAVKIKLKTPLQNLAIHGKMDFAKYQQKA